MRLHFLDQFFTIDAILPSRVVRFHDDCFEPTIPQRVRCSSKYCKFVPFYVNLDHIRRATLHYVV